MARPTFPKTLRQFRERFAEEAVAVLRLMKLYARL